MGTRLLVSTLAVALASSLGLLVQPVVASAAPPTAAAEAGDPPAPSPFTLAVIPDTQGYSVSDTLATTAQAQTQWVVDHRSDLNIAFTVQLGDLVESWPNTNQWNRITSAFATLDQNGVPYSVLPGNHDIDFGTGNAPTYNQYFPPSRFSGAAWNTPSTKYGGYLGSDTFGPDPVNRQNMDNFNLFSAGGVDWLLLNLEFESPDYTLAWAQKVIDAHPTRRVILATHGFVDTRGWRNDELYRTDAGVKTSNQVWNELVYRNCNIDFVLNGHYHDGDLSEARRTDANACGEPVEQLLSDYQERPNGGDGWLRYYTFDPGHDTVEASTYSVTKQAFETDIDSSFTLPYDFSPDPSVKQDVVVPGGTAWKYRTAKTAWPAGWDSTAYDDSAWPSGVAPLGFPTGLVNTNIDLGPPTTNRAQSALFRRTFDLADLPGVTRLRLVTKADDGLVVRVNGQEVGRTSMPAGTVAAGTAASAAPRSMAAQQVTYDVPLSLLKPTGNVIAASLHLNSLGTVDAHFDLVGVATRSTVVQPPPTTEDVTLVDNAAGWRWRFTNDPWPATWTGVGFDDSGWAQGPAPLGFGATVSTNIDVPAPTSNRPRSALFRRAFTIDDVSRYSNLQLTTRADDGMVISLNGVELNRTRLPTGTLSSATYATAAPSTAVALASPVVVTVPAAALRTGTNVLSAATVLNYKGTPNATFAARLTAVRTTAATTQPPATPTLQVDGTTSTTASLSWTAGAGAAATGWVLRRGTTTVAELPAATQTYTETGLSPATTYGYTLTAVNAAGELDPRRRPGDDHRRPHHPAGDAGRCRVVLALPLSRVVARGLVGPHLRRRGLEPGLGTPRLRLGRHRHQHRRPPAHHQPAPQRPAAPALRRGGPDAPLRPAPDHPRRRRRGRLRQRPGAGPEQRGRGGGDRQHLRLGCSAHGRGRCEPGEVGRAQQPAPEREQHDRGGLPGELPGHPGPQLRPLPGRNPDQLSLTHYVRFRTLRVIYGLRSVSWCPRTRPPPSSPLRAPLAAAACCPSPSRSACPRPCCLPSRPAPALNRPRSPRRAPPPRPSPSSAPPSSARR